MFGCGLSAILYVWAEGLDQICGQGCPGHVVVTIMSSLGHSRGLTTERLVKKEGPATDLVEA